MEVSEQDKVIRLKFIKVWNKIVKRRYPPMDSWFSADESWKKNSISFALFCFLIVMLVLLI